MGLESYAASLPQDCPKALRGPLSPDSGKRACGGTPKGSPCTIPNCETRSRPRVSTMANDKAKKKATKKVEKAVRKAVKKGVTEGAVEKAVSQGMANGAKKKPVGKAAAAADAQEAKTACGSWAVF